MGFFTGEGIAIDLGTANTTIYLEKEGIVLREPTSVLTLADESASVLAVGSHAYRMRGRTNEETMMQSPVMDGAVTDSELAALLILALAEKATGRRRPMEKAQLLVSMSQGLTKVEREALLATVRMTGAKRSAVVKTPLAAALGAGLTVNQPRGVMVVVLGAGVTEIAVISMSAIVAARSMRTGFLHMDEAIVRYLRREKGILIGLSTAEDLKCDIGSALVPPEEEEGEEETEIVLLKGRDVKTGKPLTVNVTARDIALALQDNVELLLDAIQDALGRMPSELAGDILDNGILLSGGGALLKGLAERLAERTGLTVRVGEHPHEDVILGLGMLAEDEQLLRSALDGGSASGQ